MLGGKAGVGVRLQIGLTACVHLSVARPHRDYLGLRTMLSSQGERRGCGLADMLRPSEARYGVSNGAQGEVYTFSNWPKGGQVGRRGRCAWSSAGDSDAMA
jgi:hypothetical protein